MFFFPISTCVYKINIETNEIVISPEFKLSNSTSTALFGIATGPNTGEKKNLGMKLNRTGHVTSDKFGCTRPMSDENKIYYLFISVYFRRILYCTI